MKTGRHLSFWLRVEEAKVLVDFCRRVGVSRSGFVRDAVLEHLKVKCYDDLVRKCGLRKELEDLFMEERRLRRLSDKILSDNVYLRPYARRLISGGMEDDAHRYRPALTSAPNAAEVILAFEGIFANRKIIGDRLVELARELYPGEYGLSSIPSSGRNNRHIPVNNVRDEYEGES
jgi:hypothetical protein